LEPGSAEKISIVKLPSKMKKNTLKVTILSFTLPIFLINRFWQLVNKIKSRLPKKKIRKNAQRNSKYCFFKLFCE